MFSSNTGHLFSPLPGCESPGIIGSGSRLPEPVQKKGQELHRPTLPKSWEEMTGEGMKHLQLGPEGVRVLFPWILDTEIAFCDVLGLELL